MSKPRKAKPAAAAYLPRAYMDCEVRAIDTEKRQATFVAATENGVLTWNGREHLRMSGASLKRYRRNPVVLDAHNRYSAEFAVGTAEIKIEGRELIAVVTYASTDRAETIWQLVQDKVIRTVSVGFLPDSRRTVRLAEGEEDVETRDGKPDEASRIKGPATVIKGWELFEISMVPVPADPDAVRREIEEWVREFGGDLTLDENEPDAQRSAGGDSPEQPDKETVMKNLFETWAATRGHQLAGLDEKRRAELEAECERELMPQAKTKPAAAPAPDPKPAAPAPERSVVERLRELAPRALPQNDVDRIVGENAGDFEAGRRALLAELAKRTAPAGTPEPTQPETSAPAPAAKEPEKLRAEMADVLKRALTD